MEPSNPPPWFGLLPVPCCPGLPWVPLCWAGEVWGETLDRGRSSQSTRLPTPAPPSGVSPGPLLSHLLVSLVCPLRSCRMGFGRLHGPFLVAHGPRVMEKSPLAVPQSRKPLMESALRPHQRWLRCLPDPWQLAAQLGVHFTLHSKAMGLEQTSWLPVSYGQTCFSCLVCCC